jgi:hypothetical protein
VSEHVESLATYQHAVARIAARWPSFLEKRDARLEQQRRHGVAAEKVAENIVEDLFTEVLDWTVADLNNQVGYADLLLTRLGIKYLLVEVKRPDSLAWRRSAVEQALDQACRYAAEQKVKCVAVSDGVMLYAADIEHGGLHDRVFASLAAPEPPVSLWWLSVHGIYRHCEDRAGAALDLVPQPGGVPAPSAAGLEGCLLHSKYRLPASCFGYVGDAAAPATWKLPYRLADGSPDARRLPKAVQCILSNYRGAKVAGVPESAIPEVLERLGRAVAVLGHMPQQSPAAAPVYEQLAQVLDQLGRLDSVLSSVNPVTRPLGHPEGDEESAASPSGRHP